MEKFSSEEIESQYNLIKMLLAEPEKYRDAINAIKKEITYMQLELKKNFRKKILSYELGIMAFIITVDFKRLVNINSRKLTKRV